jgi:hypothetical protein
MAEDMSNSSSVKEGLSSSEKYDQFKDEKSRLDNDLKYGIISKLTYDMKAQELKDRYSMDKEFPATVVNRKLSEAAGLPKEKSESKATPIEDIRKAAGVVKPLEKEAAKASPSKIWSDEEIKKDQGDQHKRNEDYGKAHSVGEAKPASVDTDYQTALNKVKTKYDTEKEILDKEYKDRMTRSEWAEVAETIGHAMVRVGAAAYGLKKGVDLSKIDMQKVDWEKPRSRRSEEYLTKLKLLSDKKNEESRALENIYLKKMDLKEREGKGGLSAYEAGMLEEKKLSREDKSKNDIRNLAQDELNRIGRIVDNPNLTEKQKADRLFETAESQEQAAWYKRLVGIGTEFSPEKFQEVMRKRIDELEKQKTAGEMPKKPMTKAEMVAEAKARAEAKLKGQ